jgi:DNA-binding MarR family transcriptional regulator
MSRQSRKALEAEAAELVRRWQVDQDIFDDAAAAYAGLNRTDLRVIDIVQQAGRVTAGRIATEARLTSGAVTAVVDRLETLGLVRRIRDTVDRRRVLIEVVMPKVAERLGPVYGPIAEEAYRDLASYSDHDLATILAFLRKNREFLGRHIERVHALMAPPSDVSG